MFYFRSKSLEYLNSLKFQFMKSRKLSDLCSKIYEKWLNLSAAKKGSFKIAKLTFRQNFM